MTSIDVGDTLELDGKIFRIFGIKDNEISIHDENGCVKTIVLNPEENHEGMLKCSCCGRWFEEGNGFEHKDGKHHLCFKCY